MKKANYEFVKKMISEAKIVRIDGLRNIDADVLLVPENHCLTPQDYSDILLFLETICPCRFAIGYDERLEKPFTSRVLDKYDYLEKLLLEYVRVYMKYCDYKNMLYSDDHHLFKVTKPFLWHQNAIQNSRLYEYDDNNNYVPCYTDEVVWYWKLYNEGVLKIAPEHFKSYSYNN